MALTKRGRPLPPSARSSERMPGGTGGGTSTPIKRDTQPSALVNVTNAQTPTNEAPVAVAAPEAGSSSGDKGKEVLDAAMSAYVESRVQHFTQELRQTVVNQQRKITDLEEQKKKLESEKTRLVEYANKNAVLLRDVSDLTANTSQPMVTSAAREGSTLLQDDESELFEIEGPTPKRRKCSKNEDDKGFKPESDKKDNAPFTSWSSLLRRQAAKTQNAHRSTLGAPVGALNK